MSKLSISLLISIGDLKSKMSLLLLQKQCPAKIMFKSALKLMLN